MLRKNISKVFIIIAFVAFLQILGTIILARNLIKPEMGLYRLILTIVDLGTLVSLIGIDYSLVRFFSSPGISFDKYNWKGFLKRFSLISLLLIFIISSVVSLIYNFNLFIILSIIVILSMITSIFLLASLLRARQQFALAMFFSRMNFLVFFIFLITFYIVKGLSFVNALFCYTIAAILTNFVCIYYCVKHIPSGKLPIPRSVLKNGFYYFVIGISLILILQSGNLFIGKMLSYKDLAVFAVIASVMRIFEFVQDSSYYVLAPYLNIKTDIPVKKIFIKLLFIGLGIALIYMLTGRAIVHFLFKGLYDEGLYLIPFFVGIGVVRTLYILPASIIGGRGSDHTLRNQCYMTSLAAILNICLTYVFIIKWQLKGAALANLITWIVLLIMALLGTKRYIIYNESNYVNSEL